MSEKIGEVSGTDSHHTLGYVFGLWGYLYY
jgi:hypothetical protein